MKKFKIVVPVTRKRVPVSKRPPKIEASKKVYNRKKESKDKEDQDGQA